MTSLSQTAPAESQIRHRCRDALDSVRRELLEARNGAGHWEGELAASALSTATAVSAMAAVLLDQRNGNIDVDPELAPRIRQGMGYLRGQQRSDGGFGDTDRSHSNIATSYLVLAASALAEQVGEEPLAASAVEKLNAYLDREGRLEGLRRRYGKDKTFVVPIMNNMAIAGLISWDEVAALPFEAAVFPQSMYRFLRMPVVSYAIPALVAIGQARHFLGRKALAPIRWIRSLCVERTLSVLRRMQPDSGGYLEATPLTAFVVMSLAATGRSDLAVVDDGLKFLKRSMLADGCWPIDTNLATWVTSLSIHALACDPDDRGEWYDDALATWHLDCQHSKRHPFTGAEPGGWGWTDLSGAVPDSDDTPAAILAISIMKPFAGESIRARIEEATERGIRWLEQLQNRNGGWPTFCRGWGKLPFDRSSTDLTAHALRALRIYQSDRHRVRVVGSAKESVPARESLAQPPGGIPHTSLDRAESAGLRFLAREQTPDGSWLPLWFGNQDRSDESNPIYGTAKVLIAGGIAADRENAAADFLIQNQNPDGGWGGGASLAEKISELGEKGGPFQDAPPTIPAGLTSSVEETALAVEALSTLVLRSRDESPRGLRFGNPAAKSRSDEPEPGFNEAEFHAPGTPNGSAGKEGLIAAILRGVEFLAQSVDDRRHQIAWPIGFYFAKLWYHERLYPLIFTAAALGKFLRATAEQHDPDWPR